MTYHKNSSLQSNNGAGESTTQPLSRCLSVADINNIIDNLPSGLAPDRKHLRMNTQSILDTASKINKANYLNTVIGRGLMKLIYTLLGRRNVGLLTPAFQHNITMRYPSEVSAGGLYEGKEASTLFLEKLFNQFKKIKFTPLHTITFGSPLRGKFSILCINHAKITNKSGIEVEYNFVQSFVFDRFQAASENILIFNKEKLKVAWDEA